MDRRTVLGTTATLLLGGCATGMVGRDNGPEPFGGKAYRVEPPGARLRRTLKIVLLTFKDDRPQNSRNLEWTRQASNYEDTVGQATEVRPEFENAIRSGLLAHTQIRLVARETFLQNRDADMLISGRIIRCDADRKMAWSTNNYIGESVIEVTLRDGQGKQLWSKPLQFASKVVNPIPGLAASKAKYLDEIRPGYVAAAVEDSIRVAVQHFISSKAFAEALVAAENR
jgi:hypothetical protein